MQHNCPTDFFVFLFRFSGIFCPCPDISHPLPLTLAETSPTSHVNDSHHDPPQTQAQLVFWAALSAVWTPL